GLQAGLPEDRQVLRLPRLARCPAGDRSEIAAQPQQYRQDLRAVPYRGASPVRGLSHARHAPRPGALPAAVLDLLGHDVAAGGNVRGVRRAYSAVASPVARISPRPEET